MRIRVGTSNPLKTEAVQRAANAYFGTSCHVEATEQATSDDGAPDSDEHAISAARARARQALITGGCDVGVGIESSLRYTNYGGFITCWVVVIDANGRESLGAGPQLLLPDILRKTTQNGTDLRKALALASDQFASSSAGSPVDFLTCDVFSRGQMIFIAALMALAETARAATACDI